MAPRLMLLDSASLYFRAFFGVPDRFTGLDGTPTNAVRGFADAVTMLIAEHRPDELVACWDDDWRPQFRVDLVATYKAHRVAGPADPVVASGTADDRAPTGAAEEVPDALAVQVPIISALLAAYGICRRGAPGFEADDVIAWFARGHEGPVDVVTGDRDLFQLVDDDRGVRVLYTARGMRRLQMVDAAWVRGKYGVDPRHYADLAILRGDASDGLPGVPGIGDKTAARLIAEHGGVTEVMAAATDRGAAMTPAVRTRLLGSADYVRRADPVVRLTHPVPLAPQQCPLPARPADPDALAELSRAYRLEGPVSRLSAALAERAAPDGTAAPAVGD
jgi:5'-3' exonuclease